ncbi:hypothetical protein GQ44DRAFT_714148 [Phaeosphaeriaceae sp. PMI808]|nr:hypothetical protein GQ44DRAFT_714148 [Phaeosphaeriaceae sp. PMI808]
MFFYITSVFIGGTVFVLASNISLASAEPIPSLTDILLPSPNVTSGPVGEIKCYALPYGAVGIISHLLTYWTIAWMAIGKIPLWPWHPMKTYKFDMFLAVISLCTCIPIAAITMHRCRLSWHFLLICIWKLITSVSLACITIHRCIIIRRSLQNANNNHNNIGLNQHPYGQYQNMNQAPYHNGMYQPPNQSAFFAPNPQPNAPRRDLTPLWWLTLYLSGTIVGMVGLCSLLYTTFRADPTIRNLTYGFGAAMSIIPILVAIYWFKQHLDLPGGGSRVFVSAFWHTVFGGVLAFTAVFGFFSSLYSDLVLGSIAGNLFGLPSEDFAPLYWAWFVAKRLPMLSL